MHGSVKIAVSLLAAAVLLGGCVSPQDQDKGATVSGGKSALKDKHVVMTCRFESDGNEGIHAKLKDCTGGEVTKGKIEKASIQWNGAKDVGSWRPNREAQVTATVYYPTPHGNQVLQGVKYSVEDKKTGAFEGTVKFPVDKAGFGDYKVCFNLGGFKEIHPWKPGYQAKNDPTKPDPTCKKFKLRKEGLL